MKRYESRGASSSKTAVHQAIRKLDLGLFAGAFCKIVSDPFSEDPESCLVLHADGAGTKAALAYLIYQENKNCSVFHGIAHDAIVMNTDDLLCIGACGPMLLSSTIGRNSHRISSEILEALIDGTQESIRFFETYGIPITFAGGETADLGDLIRTLVVDATVVTRLNRSEVIANDKIQGGDLIMGLSSSGQAVYEEVYNSGIGSNGLTSARHDLLHPSYALRYPESYAPETPTDMVYSGTLRIDDSLVGTPLSIGEALLSPTRTYAPLIRDLLASHRHLIHGMVHCSGGGQTKCLRFGNGIRYLKNNLFDIPPLFRLIQQTSQTSWREMYEVYNMGHRLELFGTEELWSVVAKLAERYCIEAKVVGVCQSNLGFPNELQLESEQGRFDYRLNPS